MQGRTQEPETSRPATLQALLAQTRVLADDVVEENIVMVSADPDSEEAVECHRWARVVVQMLTQAAEIAVAPTVWMGSRFMMPAPGGQPDCEVCW